MQHGLTTCSMLPCILKVSLAAGFLVLFTNAAPEIPVWPQAFHAVLLINRTNKLALADLWWAALSYCRQQHFQHPSNHVSSKRRYDWPARRNLLQAGVQHLLPLRAL